MTFSDPVGWPSSAPRPWHAAAHTAASADAPSPEERDLPPLPTLAPLPRIKPLAPMPSLPTDDEVPAVRPAAPPPPIGHPAWGRPAVGQHEMSQSGVGHAATGHAAAHQQAVDRPVPSGAAGESAEAPSAWAPAEAAIDNAAPSNDVAAHAPTIDRPTFDTSAFEVPTVTTPTLDPSAFRLPGGEAPGAEVAASRGARPVGRHASTLGRSEQESLPLAPGLRVLVIGGAEPLGAMVAERLIAAGHRLAVHGVTIPSELPEPVDRGPQFLAFEPIPLAGDRADTEEMVHTVARAEVALGGLDALIVLPAGISGGVGLDADASTWADEWSLALTTEVLAASCATHIAARSFLARRKAGRIVLVTNGRDGAQPGAMPTAATRAAIDRLGSDLARELGPHGIGVSVVSTGPGGAADFAVAQVADVVEALLSTPVLSGVSSRIG